MGPVRVIVTSGRLVLRLDGRSTFRAARLGQARVHAPAGASLSRWRGVGWAQLPAELPAQSDAPRSA